MTNRPARRLQSHLQTLTPWRAVMTITVVAATLAFAAAILMWAIDPAIGSFGTALWWAVVTVTTVGYGDVVPATGGGKVVAAMLMLMGISLIPTITSTVVSVLIARRAHEDQQRFQEEREQFMRMLESIDHRLAERE